jgi:hypothetical protein
VGAVESVGLVNAAAIGRGDADPQFNNHGGFDRFWLGPEAGQFGLYFPPGAAFDRQVWKVPRDLNAGAFQVRSQDARRVVLERSMEVTNHSGSAFQVHVEREVGMLGAAELPAELGVSLPPGVAHVGAYSRNTIRNAGAAAWTPEKGLVGIWILGMFNPGDRTVIIAPFRAGSDADLGPAFNDAYFGKVSVEAPDRLKVLPGAVLLRADSRRVGKVGISQPRTTGLAGSIDFARGLLTVVRFDVAPLPERYGNATWVKPQPEPYRGDTFQTYNSGVAGDTTGQLPDAPFYELESASPVRPLEPGETLTHRHATHFFQGDLEKLAGLARQVLGVDFEEVQALMLPGEAGAGEARG